jgi:hypothetical protein
MLEKVRKRADDFDVVHFHIDWLHLPLVREFSVATLTTLHGRLDRLELKALYFAFSDLPFVSVSDHQRQPLRNINWAGTVYHGLPPSAVQAAGYRRLPRVSRSNIAREASGPGDTDCGARWHAAEDGRQD